MHIITENVCLSFMMKICLLVFLQDYFKECEHFSFRTFGIWVHWTWCINIVYFNFQRNPQRWQRECERFKANGKTSIKYICKLAERERKRHTEWEDVRKKWNERQSYSSMCIGLHVLRRDFGESRIQFSYGIKVMHKYGSSCYSDKRMKYFFLAWIFIWSCWQQSV